MSNDIIKKENYNVVAEEDISYYGKYLRRAKGCAVCLRTSHMDINLKRAKQHMTIQEISDEENLGKDILNMHFRNHFIIATDIQRILDLKENTGRESLGIISKILDGEIDLFHGVQGIQESKMQRLAVIHNRIKELADLQEQQPLEDIELQEFYQLNKLAEESENSMAKLYQITDKKFFPSNREDLSNAILSYKLNVLNKILDAIQVEFMQYEKDPIYAPLIQQIRVGLSKRFNFLESTIMQSGGVIQLPKEEKDPNDDGNEGEI